ncbi:unnamed protein product [Prorocentrum cordatum]|uniref:C3H1-type domain-containing protein n=1 Tax=Prorocentrum cordatum TaxID=2364126 RepID=A0ABN9W192_9DINO|nr:unnamed protein product [Polarella glacialis]
MGGGGETEAHHFQHLLSGPRRQWTGSTLGATALQISMPLPPPPFAALPVDVRPKASGPCYVMPSPQNQRRTPSLSPQIPLAHLHGYSASSIDALDGDKSMMVCRHWKSKGWCRLEGGCKFLHPDSKRGTGVPPKRGGGAGGREGAGPAGEGTPPGGGAAAAAGESTRSSGTRSRRSGRGRNNRGQNASGAAGPDEGHTPGAAPAHVLTMQGAPPNGPGRHDEGVHDR